MGNVGRKKFNYEGGKKITTLQLVREGICYLLKFLLWVGSGRLMG